MGLKENEKINEYVNSICSKVKNSKVHKEIKDEVTGHIEEIYEEYLSEGLSEDEAAEKAIAHMGDAVLVGRQFDKVHRETPEWSILFLTLIFSGFGLLTMYLIETNGLANGGSSSIFSKSTIGILVGTAVAVGMYFIDYRKIQDYSKYVYIGTVIGLLISIFFGSPVNGRPWLNIGSIGINLFVLSPFLFIVALSGLLKDLKWKETNKAIYGFILILVPPVLMLPGRSLSVIVFYSVAVIILLLVSGAKFRYVSLLIASGISIIMFYFINEPYRLKALLIFLHPEKDPRGTGYINTLLDKFIHSAGLWGQGFTFSKRVLPSVQSEFVFTYIVYTFGWAAGILLAALILLFLIRISRIAFIVKDQYGKLLISGLTAIFAIEFLWNLLMNLGLAPITAVGLPFISYGNSQFIFNMAVIGLVSSIYKQKNAAKNLTIAK